MSTLGENLRKLRKAKKMTQKELSLKSGVKQSVISDLETGSAKSTGSILELANALGVTAEELKKGVLPQRDGKPIEQVEFQNIEDWDDDTPLDDDEVEIPFYKDFLLACGNGALGEALRNEKRKLRLSKQTLKVRSVSKENACAMTAMDNSMSPTINHGNTVYVDKGRTQIKNGKVFAIEHGGLFRCKRLYQLPQGGVRIVSDNDAEYPDEILNAQDIIDQEFKIIGWVFSWQTLENW